MMEFGSEALAILDGICPQHCDDDYLRKFVEDDIDGQEWVCAICGQEGTAVARVVDIVVDSVHKWFERANEAGVPFDEGDWVFPIMDTQEVLMDLGLEYDSPLFPLIEGKLGEDAWVNVGSNYPNARELLHAGWNAFSERLKHRSRFLFETTETDQHYGGVERLGTKAFLDELLNAVMTHQPPLRLGPDDEVFRARVFSERGKHPRSISEYTSPPEELASQGRMNPAGISYFYGSREIETAAVEVYDGKDFAAIATFNPVKELQVIDLTNVTIPSVFDSSVSLKEHQQAWFLSNFASEISKPIVRDDRIHQEYVPTQAFTEYVRFRTIPRVDGIAFSSARSEGTNIVFFADQSQCLTHGEPTSMLAPQGKVSIIEYGAPSASVLGSEDLSG
jgi:RES domain-containing protein